MQSSSCLFAAVLSIVLVCACVDARPNRVVRQAAANSCSPNPCLNGGRCFSNGNSFTCFCTQSFAGKNCEQFSTFTTASSNTNAANTNALGTTTGAPGITKAGGCSDQSCLNGGLCFPNGNSFVCFCKLPFTGTFCEQNSALTTVSSNTNAMVTNAPTTNVATNAPTTIAATNAPTNAAATNAPATNAPATNAATNAPITNAPVTNAPATNAPTNAPATNAAPTDAATNAPATNAPATNAAPTDAATNAPATNAPATNVAPTDAPTNAAVTNAPTNAPITNAATNAANTNAPTTNAPTTVAMTSNGANTNALAITTGAPGATKAGGCSNQPCLNGGQCFPNGNSFVCFCKQPFTGAMCEQGSAATTVPSNTNAANTNAFGATTAASLIAPTTVSTLGCASQPCLNGASCFRNGNGFVCVCAKPFSGRNCEIRQA